MATPSTSPVQFRQTSTNPPPLTEYTVSYQNSREVLVGIYFRRFLRRKSTLRKAAIVLVIAVLLCFASPQFRWVGFAFIAYLLLLPLITYNAFKRTVDQSSQLTAQKSLTFGPSGIRIVGPNYRNDFEWSAFRNFSEDATYFYLGFSKADLNTVMPKSAFTVEQQEAMRRFGWALKK